MSRDIIKGGDPVARVAASWEQRLLYASIAVRNEGTVDLEAAELRLEAVEEQAAPGRWVVRRDIVSRLLAVSADARSRPREHGRTDIRPGDAKPFDVLVPVNEHLPDSGEWFIVAANPRVRTRLAQGKYRFRLTLSARDLAAVELPPMEVELLASATGELQSYAFGVADEQTPDPGAGVRERATQQHVIAQPAASGFCDGGDWDILAADFQVIAINGTILGLSANTSLVLRALHELARPAKNHEVMALVGAADPDIETDRVGGIIPPASPLRSAVVDHRSSLWWMTPHGHASGT